MLSNFETAWRYPAAIALGLIAGLYIGGMLATIYVIVAFRESLDTLNPVVPWFLRYPWADLAARPSILKGALSLRRLSVRDVFSKVENTGLDAQIALASIEVDDFCQPGVGGKIPESQASCDNLPPGHNSKSPYRPRAKVPIPWSVPVQPRRRQDR